MGAKGIGVGIVGMGAYLPDEVRTNDWWPTEWRQDHEQRIQRDVLASVDQAAANGDAGVDPEIVRYAGPFFADLFRGVKERRVMPEGMKPSEMETAACRAAIEHAGLAPDQVDGILGYSVLQDSQGVENPSLVARNLGLPHECAALAVTAACASWVHQLRVASLLVHSGECKNVLIYVSSEVSRLNDYSSPSSVVTGDGAVAAVIGRVEDGLGYVRSSTRTHGEHHDAIMLVPRDAPPGAPWWEGQGALILRRVDAEAAHEMGTRSASVCRSTVEHLFAQTGVTVDDVDFMAVSQAGAWFGPALADSIGLPHSKVLPYEDQYARYGHLMAGSVALNLLIAHERGHLKKGDLVLVYTPGLGFTTGASLIRWTL